MGSSGLRLCCGGTSVPPTQPPLSPVPGPARPWLCLSLPYLLHTMPMTTTAMRNTSPAAEEPMMSGSFSCTLVWYSAGTQGQGNRLLWHGMAHHAQGHHRQRTALSTGHVCFLAWLWPGTVRTPLWLGDVSQKEGWMELFLLGEKFSPVDACCALSLAPGPENWLGLFYLAGQI